MFEELSKLKQQAESNLQARTGGSRSRFLAYALVLYPVTAFRFASALNRPVVSSMIDALSGNDVLFAVLQPLEYERKSIIVHPTKMIMFQVIPVNAPAKWLKKLTGEVDNEHPWFILLSEIPTIKGPLGNVISWSQRQSVIAAKLDAFTEDEYVSRLEELCNRLGEALEPFRDEDSPSPDDVFLQLESSFKKYKKAQILRKAKRIVTGGLDLVGSIPGL